MPQGPRPTRSTLTPTTRRSARYFFHPSCTNIFQRLIPIQVCLLEGTLTDRTLGEEWQKGAYAYRKPHMPHGPYTSRTGCVMFVTCSGEGA
jgi:hypothetical protein